MAPALGGFIWDGFRAGRSRQSSLSSAPRRADAPVTPPVPPTVAPALRDILFFVHHIGCFFPSVVSRGCLLFVVSGSLLPPQRMILLMIFQIPNYSAAYLTYGCLFSTTIRNHSPDLYLLPPMSDVGAATHLDPQPRAVSGPAPAVPDESPLATQPPLWYQYVGFCTLW